MNQKFFKAVVELIEASYLRDFVSLDGGGEFEVRVFNAVSNILDVIESSSEPEFIGLRDWVHQLQMKTEAHLLQIKTEEA